MRVTPGPGVLASRPVFGFRCEPWCKPIQYNPHTLEAFGPIAPPRKYRTSSLTFLLNQKLS